MNKWSSYFSSDDHLRMDKSNFSSLLISLPSSPKNVCGSVLSKNRENIINIDNSIHFGQTISSTTHTLLLLLLCSSGTKLPRAIHRELRTIEKCIEGRELNLKSELSSRGDIIICFYLCSRMGLQWTIKPINVQRRLSSWMELSKARNWKIENTFCYLISLPSPAALLVFSFATLAAAWFTFMLLYCRAAIKDPQSINQIVTGILLWWEGMIGC